MALDSRDSLLFCSRFSSVDEETCGLSLLQLGGFFGAEYTLEKVVFLPFPQTCVMKVAFVKN